MTCKCYTELKFSAMIKVTSHLLTLQIALTCLEVNALVHYKQMCVNTLCVSFYWGEPPTPMVIIIILFG